MKRIFLLIISALFSGVMWTSCSSDKSDPISANRLYVFGDVPSVTKSGTDQTDFLVFTGDDIVSFDFCREIVQLWGQIYFTEGKVNEIISRVKLYSELHFMIDDKPVFEPPIRIYRGISNAVLDLQFFYEGSSVFFTDINMTRIDSLSFSSGELEELAANKQKRRQELDVLIAYLKDAGKLLNEIFPDIPEIEPHPSDTICSFLFDIENTVCDTLVFVVNETHFSLNDMIFSLIENEKVSKENQYISFTAVDSTTLHIEQGLTTSICLENVAVEILSEKNNIIVDFIANDGGCNGISPARLNYNISGFQVNSAYSFTFKRNNNFVLYTTSITFSTDLNQKYLTQ